jgi:hypothetical protein
MNHHLTEEGLITFQSVHQVICVEKLLQQENIAYEVIPTPREISLSCGQCLVIEAAQVKQVKTLLVQEAIRGWKLFRAERNRRIYEEIGTTGG